MIPRAGGLTVRGRWRARELLPWLVLALIVFGMASCFSWLGVARHAAFQSHAFDLGNMDQAVWNTLHGSPLRFTDMVQPAGSEGPIVGAHLVGNRLAIHVEPLLLPISLLYLLHSGPETLLVLQSVVVASGAVPAYLLARQILGRPWVSLAFPLAYALHPSLQNALLDDFHAVTLSAAFLLWAMYWLYAGAMVQFWIAALLALSTKEEVGLLIAMLGFAALARHRSHGVVLLLLGAAWFVVCVAIVIPHFNSAGQSPYLERYAYLGHGLRGVIGGVLLHPGTVAHTLTSVPRLTYLGALLSPLGFVSLLGLPVLLLATPSLAINMLSTDSTMYSGFYQYSAEVVPYVIVAAIVGTGAASRAGHNARAAKWIAPSLACLVVFASAAATRVYGFTPLSDGYIVPSAGAHQKIEQRFVQAIPRTAVVAAADEIEPHVSERRTVYLLPTIRPQDGPPAEFVVLDASVPGLPTLPSTLHDTARWALEHGFRVEAGRDGILVLRRGAGMARLPPGFFTFAYAQPPASASRETAVWGRLRLVAVTVHPRYAWINRSRPAIEVETYWRATAKLPSAVRVRVVALTTWGTRETVTDSPTWDWLPPGRWPPGRIVHAALVPMTFPTDRTGRVTLALQVLDSGPLSSVASSRRVAGLPNALAIGTIDVRP